MSLIKSLLGRRQFLIAATAASTSALPYKKIAKVVAPVFHTSNAMAAESAGAAVKGVTKTYSHLLSPIKIRNVIVKNRMIHTPSTPHFLQGPESYPTESVRAYYETVARSAAMVYIKFPGEPMGAEWSAEKRRKEFYDGAHNSFFDLTDPAVMNYIDQMIEGIHVHGSLVIGSLNWRGGHGRGVGGNVKIEDIVTQAKEAEDQGIDVIEMGVRNMQDQNAVGSAIEQMQAVRRSTNLIIMMSASAIEPSLLPEFLTVQGSGSIEDAIALAKTFQGYADIMQIQIPGLYANHPIGYNQEKDKPLALRFAHAIKESGAKIIIAPRGGFNDPDLNEEFIASGKTDMLCMARSFIADPDYTEKLYEGRGEDVVPCIMCNKCHGLGMQGPWYSVCSVNPRLGLDSPLKLIKPPNALKKVAVIGGGVGGMKAALVAAERGHKVTLYEKNAYLGGLLRIADYDPYKWPYKDFREYLIHQMDKAGVEVFLNTTATPVMIKAKGYDAVMVAIGSEPVKTTIPGADGSNTYNIVTAFTEEKSMGKNVVLIGGGEWGLQTSMFLAKVGHKVTMLTSEKLLNRVNRPHYPEILQLTYDELTATGKFNYIFEVIAKGISGGKVTYVDAKGNENSIQADSVVIYAGLKPKQDEALKFYDSARAFFSIGDCTGKSGTVQKSIRSAFFMASQV